MNDQSRNLPRVMSKSQNSIAVSLCARIAMAALLLCALAPAAQATPTTLPAGTTSWTVPAGVTSIQVEMWGAGGGGGGVSYTTAAGGGAGGGGGAYTRTYLTVTPGQNITGITVPSGGAAGTSAGVAGGSPGNTTFPGATTANSGAGGNGKTTSSVPAASSGGSAAASPANSYAGGNGSTGSTTTRGGGGGGSGSSYCAGQTVSGGLAAGNAGGGGGLGGTGQQTTTGTGTAGSTPGGGGGGGFTTAGGSATAGSAGGDGRIIITYTANTFYYQSGNPATAANWNTVQAGGGTAATDFTDGNFIIPSGKTATATTDWTVASASGATPSLSTITINSGGKLNMAGFALKVAGSFNNKGTFISGSGSPTITFTSGGGFFTPGVGTLSSVAVQGAGGQAAGTATGAGKNNASGGGGGGCASITSLSVGSSTVYTVIVGLGGNGNASWQGGNGYSQLAQANSSLGTSGGNSIFSGGIINSMTANGGAGGTRNDNSAGGAGGTATVTGGTTHTGATGGSATTSVSGAGGGGAGTTQDGQTAPNGGSGSPAGGNGGAAGSSSVGGAGTPPGGGGGGGQGATAAAGGNGANGQVTIVYPAPVVPTLTTPTAISITDTSATLGATMTANGGDLSDYGIVWAASPTTTPTTANNKIQQGTSGSPGTYTVSATGLPAGTQIYYGGYGVNVAGTAYSSYSSFYTLSTEPTAHVTGPFTATAVSSSEIDLSWTSASGPPSGYLIVQTNSSSAPTGVPSDGTAYSVGNTIGDGTVVAVITSGSTASFNVTSGLSSSSTYSYAIFPYNWDGSHAATYNYYTAATVPTASANTPSASSPPGAPTGNAASSTNSSSFTASWSAGSGAATSYTVDVSTSSAFTSFVSGWQSNNVGNVFSASVASLTGGTTYYYRIYAHNAAGDSPASSTITVVTILAAPVASAASSTNSSGFTAAWAASSGATKYYLDVATDSGFTAIVSGYNNLDVGNNLSSAVTGLSVETTYYYRVRAYTAAYGSSANSSTITVKSLASLPVVSASAATGITTSAATLNGSITTTGGTITDRGFAYGTSSGFYTTTNHGTVTYSTGGTYTWVCPAGVTSVLVECWGGGGAGGSATKNSVSSGGGGGAGGAYVKKISVPVTHTQSYTVTVGAGGISVLGTVVAGGNTTFIGDSTTTVTAKGGGGGQSTTDGAGAVGAHVTGSTVGDLNNEGGDGAAGTTGGSGYGGGGGGGAGNQSPNTSGVGGNASAGSGGAGGAGNMAGGSGGAPQTASNSNGNNGVVPSGGGSGARRTSSGGSNLGGTGGSGQVVLTYNGNTPITLSDNLSGLSPNIQYYWEAFAANSAGTTFSSEQNFYTLANVPAAPTVNGATTTSLNVNTLVVGNGNPASTQYAIQETNSALYVQADGTLGASAFWQATNTWGTITVTNLSPGTTNAFQVKARNGASVETAFGPASVKWTVPNGPTLGNNGPICAGSTLNLTASTVSGATNYNWTGPNGFASNTQNPTIANATTAASGIYTNWATGNGNLNSATNTTTLTVNPLPTITLGTSPSVTYGSTSAGLPYTATGNGASQYLITYDSAAHTAGFVDVSLTTLPTSPILIPVPGSAPVATYNGTLTVVNGTTGCTGGGTSFTVTVNQASTFVGASSSKNPAGYTDSVSYTATLPGDATGSVVFSSTNGAISTNSLSSGSATSLSITNLPRGTNLITLAYLGDSNYLGSTNTLNQIVTNHPPVAVDTTFYRAKGLSLKIAITNLLKNVTDLDGDTNTLQGVGAGLTNATIMTDSSYVYYLPGTGAGSNDNDVVSYTVNDGFGGTASANILINVYSATGQSQMSIPTNGVANITFYGIPNYTYVVQTTTNLAVPWWTLSTNTAGTNGSWQFTDPNATNAQQYYRSAQP